MEWKSSQINQKGEFLYHLTWVFRFLEGKGHLPLIEFQKIPNIARWNLRAILIILTFILLHTTGKTLDKRCRSISYSWPEYWFNYQMSNENNFKDLSEILKTYKKTLHSLENHWKQKPSIFKKPNQCMEYALKVMQELYDACKTMRNSFNLF